MERIIYAADVVYNGVGLPLENAGVAVSKVGTDSTIVGFGKLEALQVSFPDARVQRLGRVILPRPVNAHTHLDLSHLPFKALPYPRWIPEHVVAHANLRGLTAAKDGLNTLRASGIAAFGDIVAREEVMDFLLTQSDLAGVAYWEVIEANPDKADAVMTATLERVRRWRKLEGSSLQSRVRLGLSPHTPFTVSSKLLQRLAEFARLEGLPLQIHVAEHPSELELFQTGQGALANALRSFKVPPFETSWGRAPSAHLSPIKYLAELRVLEAKPTLIHAVNVSEEDVRIIAQYGCSVVTCPRSNHNLECGNIPWKLFAKHGVELALGTDSSASGQSLDIREEASAALRLLDIDLKHVIRWAVKGGYRALGLKPPVIQRGDSFSSLTVWE
jgi:aminodeoxyfutalosine deaminase